MPPAIKSFIPFSSGASFVRELIQTAVLGGILMFGNVQVLGARLDAITTQIAQVQTQLHNFDRRINIVEQKTAVNAQRLDDLHKRSS